MRDKQQPPDEGKTRRDEMKICNCEIGKSLSPNGEYFRVIKHLKNVAEAWRNNPTDRNRYLLSAELEKYGARNINNNTGAFVIVF